MRRALPGWVNLENRADAPDEDLTQYEGIPATTARRALEDVRDRMPPEERWMSLVDQAYRRELIDDRDLMKLGSSQVVA